MKTKCKMIVDSGWGEEEIGDFVRRVESFAR